MKIRCLEKLVVSSYIEILLLAVIFKPTMNQTIFIFLLIVFCSCKTQDKKITDNLSNPITVSTDTLRQLSDSPDCKKCDKVIIETATERWDKLTDKQVEQFLCSFDRKCRLDGKYKNSGGTYERVAFESLVVQLDRHLNTCINLFDTNKNIDFTYILSLLENVAGHDLPWPSIITQLSKNKPLTATEEKIFDTIKKSEAAFKKKYNKPN
jgi:hypothetical protein